MKTTNLLLVDKKLVLETAIALYAAKITELRQAVASTRQAAQEAPGRLVSRYDTSREESSWLADGQAGLLAQWQYNLAALKRLAPTPCSKIKAGALALLLNDRVRVPLYYFFCPGGAGYECECAGKTIILLSPSSPLARVAAGLGKGAVFNLPGRETIRVQDVW